MRFRVLASLTSALLVLTFLLFGRHAAVATVGMAAGSTQTVGPHRSASLRQRFSRVRTWFYYLTDDFADRYAARTAASPYDVVVIDPAITIKGSEGVRIADAIARLKRHGKLVLAYVDVGEAEAYRTYWRSGWRPGHPWWIIAADPDGWAGNYPVAYWARSWQELWLGRAGILARVVASGFDGVYLDWTEAYSDSRVVAVARATHHNARREVVDFIERIARYGRTRRRGFLVVNQNAAELVASSPRLLKLLDGEAQEQLYFDGGADNRPPGDCPLPATDSQIGSGYYLAGLSPVCRRQYNEHPNSTLHVSTASYLGLLRRIHRAGLPVLTVDYAIVPKNIRSSYCRSRAEGFIPFVSERALGRFIDPTTPDRTVCAAK